MSCRFCNQDAVHFVPFETSESTERAVKFIAKRPKPSGTVALCSVCHDTYGEYIRAYYSPKFELKGAL